MKRCFVAAAALTMLLVAVGPAAAKGPPEEVTLGPFNDTVPNPCTGQLEDIEFTLHLRIHEFDNEAGNRHHANVHFFIDVVFLDTGFLGTAVGPDIDNGDGLFSDPEGTGMFQSMFNGRFENGDGQAIVVHSTIHFNQVDGVPVSEVDFFFDRCVGGPPA